MPLKIAFFGIKYFPSKGGTSRVVENLILQLHKEYDITIYCYKNKEAANHIQGVKTVQLSEIGLGNLGTFLYYFLCYCHIAFKGKYDIIHAHKIDSVCLLPGLARRAKVVATAHEAPYRSDKWGWLAVRYFKFCEKRFVGFKGIKTSISKPLAAFYREKFDIDISYIPNGIRKGEPLSKEGLADYWPKELDMDMPFILFAARRIMATKGLHTLLDALDQLRYTGHILIAGEESHSPAYMRSMKKYSATLSVHFLGFVHPLSNLLALVDTCQYFVFPSETEAMSIMLLEVASLGKPIIASDIPANTEIFNKDEVLFFQNKSVDDLVRKLSWAEENKSALNRMADAAKLKVEEVYTWDKIAEEYRSLYNML